MRRQVRSADRTDRKGRGWLARTRSPRTGHRVVQSRCSASSSSIGCEAEKQGTVSSMHWRPREARCDWKISRAHPARLTGPRRSLTRLVCTWRVVIWLSGLAGRCAVGDCGRRWLVGRAGWRDVFRSRGRSNDSGRSGGVRSRLVGHAPFAQRRLLLQALSGPKGAV